MSKPRIRGRRPVIPSQAAPDTWQGQPWGFKVEWFELADGSAGLEVTMDAGVALRAAGLMPQEFQRMEAVDYKPVYDADGDLAGITLILNERAK